MRGAPRVLLILVLTAAVPALAQQRDSLAFAVLAKMVEATGWGPAQLSTDAKVTGEYIRSAAGVERSYPATFKIKGPRRYKLEAQSGFVTILNDTEAMVRSPRGDRKLSAYSALSMRPLPLPYLSDFTSAILGKHNVQYLGTESIQGENCDHILIEPQPKPNERRGIGEQVGRMQVWVSQATHVPVQMEFTRLMGDNPSVISEYTVRYSDYRRTGTILTPFLFEEYIGNRLLYKFCISDIDLNAGLSDGEFTVPSAKEGN